MTGFYGPLPDPAADWLTTDKWLTGTRDEDEPDDFPHASRLTTSTFHVNPVPPPTPSNGGGTPSSKETRGVDR